MDRLAHLRCFIYTMNEQLDEAVRELEASLAQSSDYASDFAESSAFESLREREDAMASIRAAFEGDESLDESSSSEGDDG